MLWERKHSGFVMTAKEYPGVVVQGNIYVADPEDNSARNRLVGDNISSDDEGDLYVSESAYCLQCFYKLCSHHLYERKGSEYESLEQYRDSTDLIVNQR